MAAALIAAAALSRAAMPAAMLLSSQARTEGLAASAGRPVSRRTILGLGVGVSVSLLCLPLTTTAVVIGVSFVVAGLFLSLSRYQIGGITGDVLGAMQQLLELVGLVAVVALFEGAI